MSATFNGVNVLHIIRGLYYLKVAQSQNVFHFGMKSPKQSVESLSCAFSLYVDSAQDSDLTPFLCRCEPK